MMINEEDAENVKNEESEEEQSEDNEQTAEEETPEEKDILSRIEEIREEVEKKSDKADIEEIKGWRAEILSKMSELRKDIEELRKEDERVLANFREFTDIITKKNDDVNKIVEQKVDETKLRQFRKDMGKIDKKLNLLMEETGFGEILDVAKIPPNILEIVYDTTLSDVAKALWREYGPGAEKIITDILEDIRLETSGSEMFYFDGRRIRTRDVARNIRKGMISARQLQDTYEELLKKLLERVPGHRSKNFRAMIKLKSQEYTVDKTTFLLERVEKMENTVMMLNGMVSGLASNLNMETGRMDDELERLSADFDKKLSGNTEETKKRLQSMEKKIEAIRRENENKLAAISETLDKKIRETEEETRKRIEALEQKVFPEVKSEKKVKKSEKPKPEALTNEERFVYSAVPSDGITVTNLRKSAGSIVQAPLDVILKNLIDKGMLYEKKSGRSVRYYPTSGETEKGTEERKKLPEKAKKKEKSKKSAEKPADKKKKEKEFGKKGKEKRAKKGGKKMNESERIVLDAIPDNGCTLNRLKKELGDRMPYEELLDTVKELVEREFMVVTTRGRHTIYMKNEEKIGGEKNA